MCLTKLFGFLALLVCLLAGGTPGVRAEGTENSRYIRHEEKSSTAIVFVHGWTGNARQTWTNPKSAFYWPEQLKTDPAFAGINIFVLEYPVAKDGGGFTITDISDSLHQRLIDEKVMSHDKVIFVAHSLGGLAVRQLLLNQRDLAAKVSFLFFYGTPTEGSELASYAKYISSDPVIPALAPIPGPVDTYLSVMMHAWSKAKFPFKTYCAYERQRTKSVFVVSQSSATALCAESVPINEKHEDMVKPADTRADSYIALRNVIPEFMKSSKTGVETVDLKRTVDASRIKCDPKGGKFDEVDIDDELHFVDSPPTQYLARAEEISGGKVRVYDLLTNSEPAPDAYFSDKIRYVRVKVGVKDEYARVRYAWTNAHSDHHIEVWARPRALLRDLSVTLKLPPDVKVQPKSVRPQDAVCQWSDENRTVSCTKILSRDEPVVITWDWDAWKSCKVSRYNRQKK